MVTEHTPPSPAELFAEALALVGEHRAEIRRLKANITHVRQYAESLASDSRFGGAYGDIGGKLIVAEHADFKKKDVGVDE
ncbi:hypothetical protein [Cohnella silvisoli]|uniref:Uncharacterized protein n=1 Tax=Cohnella silvisoli TaxID=2873699 RepID=A0ABV1KZN8_9BACL|nr:hypothetical protein [Cohnella silvisoli]MCD9024381.1 hypothetical protein [Cohnella silvisoli]